MKRMQSLIYKYGSIAWFSCLLQSKNKQEAESLYLRLLPSLENEKHANKDAIISVFALKEFDMASIRDCSLFQNGFGNLLVLLSPEETAVYFSRHLLHLSAKDSSRLLHLSQHEINRYDGQAKGKLSFKQSQEKEEFLSSFGSKLLASAPSYCGICPSDYCMKRRILPIVLFVFLIMALLIFLLIQYLFFGKPHFQTGDEFRYVV